MAKQQWTHTDKTAWPPGSWQDEPDKIQWVDEETDLDCLMHRNSVGAWCGYVGVTEGHPLFAKSYESVYYDLKPEINVHGGLTYSEFCEGDATPAIGICHVPEPGRPERVWWLGFDCAHSGDVCPNTRFFNDGWYHDQQDVEAEVTHLARQLAAMTQGD